MAIAPQQASRHKMPLPTLFPAPTHPHSYFTVTSKLRSDLMSLLSKNGASIDTIQAAFTDALVHADWMHALRLYMLDIARQDENVTADELMAKVVLGIRECFAVGAAKAEEADGGVPQPKSADLALPKLPTVPKESMHKGVASVRRELELLCELAADQD